VLRRYAQRGVQIETVYVGLQATAALYARCVSIGPDPIQRSSSPQAQSAPPCDRSRVARCQERRLVREMVGVGADIFSKRGTPLSPSSAARSRKVARCVRTTRCSNVSAGRRGDYSCVARRGVSRDRSVIGGPRFSRG
jgi:hypothetical protein